MQINLNGVTTDIQDNVSISDLLSNLGYKNKRVAVEVNQEIIPRGDHVSYILSASDKVEIIHAVGGG